MKINLEQVASELLRASQKGISVARFHTLLDQQLEGTINIHHQRHPITLENGQRRTLTEIVSEGPGEEVIDTTGFHAGLEETPVVCKLALLPAVISFAQERKVRLRIFPLVNEQAAEEGTRYGSGNIGGRFNNDTIRFNNDPENGILGIVDRPDEVNWTLAPNLGVCLPPETTKLLALLFPRFRSGSVAAFVDPHADYAADGEDYDPPPGAYAFTFGGEIDLEPVLKAIEKKGVQVIRTAAQVQGAADELVYLIGGTVKNLFDGSFANLAHLMGVPLSVSPEVVDGVPLDKATWVYWYWTTFAISRTAGETPQQWLKAANRLEI